MYRGAVSPSLGAGASWRCGGGRGSGEPASFFFVKKIVASILPFRFVFAKFALWCWFETPTGLRISNALLTEIEGIFPVPYTTNQWYEV
jgi:hypothetical protein